MKNANAKHLAIWLHVVAPKPVVTVRLRAFANVRTLPGPVAWSQPAC